MVVTTEAIETHERSIAQANSSQGGSTCVFRAATVNANMRCKYSTAANTNKKATRISVLTGKMLSKPMNEVTRKRASTVLNKVVSISSPTTVDLLIMMRPLHAAAACVSLLLHVVALVCKGPNVALSIDNTPCISAYNNGPDKFLARLAVAQCFVDHGASVGAAAGAYTKRAAIMP